MSALRGSVVLVVLVATAAAAHAYRLRPGDQVLNTGDLQIVDRYGTLQKVIDLGYGHSYPQSFQMVVASPDRIYIGGAAIVEVDLESNSSTAYREIPLSQPVTSYAGLAVEPEGTLLLANHGLYRLDPGTGEVTELVPYPDFVGDNGLVEMADGTVYTTRVLTGVLRVDLATNTGVVVGGRPETMGPFRWYEALAAGPDGTLLLLGWDGDSGGRIVQIDPESGTEKVVLERSDIGFQPDYSISVAPDGWILFLLNERELLRINPKTGAVHSVPTPTAELHSQAYFIMPRDAEAPACDDGLDNDGDGFIDFFDYACRNLLPGEVGYSELVPDSECDDGIDNDGDGLVDRLQDPDCWGSANFEWDWDWLYGVAQCSDGFDNDGDGQVDWPADRGCVGPDYPYEGSACDDGVDNDLDGTADWNGTEPSYPDYRGRPPDPDCFAPWDRDESRNPSCGLGFEGAFVALALCARRRRRPMRGPHGSR